MLNISGKNWGCKYNPYNLGSYVPATTFTPTTNSVIIRCAISPIKWSGWDAAWRSSGRHDVGQRNVNTKVPNENRKCNDPTWLRSIRGVQSLLVGVAPENTTDNLWCSRPQAWPTSPPSSNQSLGTRRPYQPAQTTAQQLPGWPTVQYDTVD